MKEKDKKPLLSMAEIEESVKKRMDKLYNPVPNIKLLKQQVYTEIISLWLIDGHFLRQHKPHRGNI